MDAQQRSVAPAARFHNASPPTARAAHWAVCTLSLNATTTGARPRAVLLLPAAARHMPTNPDPPAPAAPPHPPDLRRRRDDAPLPLPPLPPPPAPHQQSAPSATTQPLPPPPPPQPAPQQPSLRARAVAGAMGIGLVTAAVGGTYLLADNEAMFPLAVAACVATFSSVLLRLALAGVKADGAARTRVRHLRSHRHLTGESAAYARHSQRLTMMDRDFTDADYELLLDLDNNSQRLRRFLEGASHETIARLPTYIYRKEGERRPRATAAGSDGEGSADSIAKEPMRTASSGQLSNLREDTDDANDSPEIARDTAKSCTICLEDFEDGMKIRILPCFHRFMADCIDPWLVQQARCPVCKFSIQEVMNKLPADYN